MFKDKFNEEMQNIKATDERKAELLSGIEVEQERAKTIPYKMSAKKRWIAAIAAAVALVIVSVTVLNLPIFGGNNTVLQTGSENSSKTDGDEIKFPVIEHKNGIPANVTYSQVYQLFSAMWKTENERYLTYTTGTGELGSDEEVVLEDSEEIDDMGEDYYDDGAAAPGGMGGEPGAVNGEENTGAKPEGATEEDFSTTNTQVEEVDEADIVKTDGKYIYYVQKNMKSTEAHIRVSKAEKGVLESVSSISISFNEEGAYFELNEVYLEKGTLIAILTGYSNNNTIVKFYNVSDPYAPKEVKTIEQSGHYLSSRRIQNMLYVFTNESIYVDINTVNKNDVCKYVPYFEIDGGDPKAVSEEDIFIYNGAIDRSYSTVFAVDINKNSIVDVKTTLGGGNTIYANTKTIYLAANGISGDYYTDDEINEYKNKTRIISYSIEKDGKITPVAEGCVDGTPLNQFSMDEYADHFRIVTTVYTNYSTYNALYILNKELKTVGSITDIAKDERVYSVRFMGDTGYFVTFRQVDPLFAVDLKDPKNPKILSALKIPGFSNYMHPWGDGLMLGIGADADEETGATGGVKLSMFDISNPENVAEKHKEVIKVLDSSVGRNHKSIFVNYEKNLIGFSPMNCRYFYLYGYTPENGFELKAELAVPLKGRDYEFYYSLLDDTRGIFIGDYFYVCSNAGVSSYSLKDYLQVDSLLY